MEKFSSEKSGLEKRNRMELKEGHPICWDCLNNIHRHSLEEGERHDCKNVGKINGREYQCHCGFGGVFESGKWINWKE